MITMLHYALLLLTSLGVTFLIKSYNFKIFSKTQVPIKEEQILTTNKDSIKDFKYYDFNKFNIENKVDSSFYNPNFIEKDIK